MLEEETKALAALDAEPTEYPEWPTNSAYTKILPEEKAEEITSSNLDRALRISGTVEGQNSTLIKHAYIKHVLGNNGLTRAQSAPDRKALNTVFAEAHGGASKQAQDALAVIDPIVALHNEGLRLDAEAQKIRGWRDALIREAVSAGTPQTSIAGALGLTRAGVSKIVNLNRN